MLIKNGKWTKWVRDCRNTAGGTAIPSFFGLYRKQKNTKEKVKLIRITLDCKTVRIFAYSSTREQSNKKSGTRLKTESETWEETLTPSRSRHRLCWRTATSAHFWSSTLSQTSNSKNCFRITVYSVKARSQVQTITRAIHPRNQLPSVSNSKRGWSCNQIFDSSTTFLNPLVGTNSLYRKRTVGFFLSRGSRASRA